MAYKIIDIDPNAAYSSDYLTALTKATADITTPGTFTLDVDGSTYTLTVTSDTESMEFEETADNFEDFLKKIIVAALVDKIETDLA